MRQELERALSNRRVRYLGDAWMLAFLVMREAEMPDDGDVESSDAARTEAWRFTSGLAGGEPLAGTASHWRCPASAMLASLDVRVTHELLTAGFVAVGHFTCVARDGTHQCP